MLNDFSSQKNSKLPIDKIFDFLNRLEWPAMRRIENRMVIDGVGPELLFESVEGRHELYFLWYNRRDNKYEYRGGLKKIIFDNKANLEKIIYINSEKYFLSYKSEIRSILQLSGDIENIDIMSINKKIEILTDQKTIKIPLKKYLQILDDAEIVNKQSNSYKDSVQRYLINDFSRKHLKREIQKKTTSKAGEFDFLVHRFNIETKKNKKDCLGYVNDLDVNSLQELVSLFIKLDLFNNEFIIRLDNYFIRKNLSKIISLGKDILKLKKDDLTTESGKCLIKRIDPTDKKIKQLETVWQKYFEQYLLYLIFTYKEIYPKIKLNSDAEKKYPDFIGVNHYNGVDIIEIKTHLTPALVWDGSHNNYAFSSELSKAIIQIMNYMDAVKARLFKEPADERKITETTNEENLYRPRGIIIISSKSKLVKGIKHDEKKMERDFTKLRGSLHDIEIITFDEIIGMAEYYKNRIVKDKS